MNNMKHLLLFLLLLPCAVCVAEPLSGIVRDEGGRPLPYATVTLQPAKQATTTDLEGRYTIADAAGAQTVAVSYIGYATQQRTLEQARQQPDFQLAEEAVELENLLVLPHGQTIEEYILRKTLAAIRPLKKRVPTFRATVRCRLEKDIDLSRMPRRRTIRFAAWVAGYAHIFDAIVDNKYLRVRLQEELTFAKGKFRGANPRLIEQQPQLTAKQQRAFLKFDALLQANVYDQFYDLIAKKAKAELKAMQASPKKRRSTADLRYAGSYQWQGHTVFIVKYDAAEVHIVDRLWQVLRMRYRDGANTMYYEFRPTVRQDTFLPVSGRIDLHLTPTEPEARIPAGTANLSVAYSY